MLKPPPYDVLAIGAPIMDQILLVSEEYMGMIPGEKGGMQIVDYPYLEKALRNTSAKPVIVPGGSASNALKGMASLGDKCAIIGKIGADKVGRLYSQEMLRYGIISLFRETATPTAQVLSFVTPDGQRTMRCFVGASVEMRGDELTSQEFERVKLVHIEGYSIYNGSLMEVAMQLAKRAGAKVSLDLGSFEIVRKFKDKLLVLLDKYVDIVFANEDEARALTNVSEEESCDYLAKFCDVAIVLMGREGCWVRRGLEKYRCKAYPVKPVDTTGAGDMFISAFLHGLLKGHTLIKCAHYGALAGRAAVLSLGVELAPETWKAIRCEISQS